ncbi:ABC transporter permease [Bifidobacterium margollesii]|uniref:ABC transporter permease n=1 Tax=Bifidobacterium margollesii TaxID=2020964 RepID=A0A2N5JAI7_9BIFI|nr:ABC transporter permease [Bifidobacterium margollesii]PLS31232.1 ABC transporter permease [Bifidobacterium margollesii]
MFILRNAWRSVTRNKGRNILIVIIVAIIAAAATIGLSIRDAAQTARDEGLQNTTVTATISVDREKLMSEARSSSSSSSDSDGKPDFDAMRSALDQSSLTLSDYLKYAKASSVKVSTYYTEETSVSATDDFQPVESSTSNSSGSSSSDSTSDSASSETRNGGDQNGQPGPGDENGQGDRGMVQGDFSLTGFSSDTAVANARNGSFTMVDGEVFGYDSASNGEAIISKSLADFNDLSVGDTITVTNPSDESTTYKLKIVGIYKNSTSENTTTTGPMGGTSQDAANAIYTSVSTLKSLGLDSDTTATAASSSDSSSEATTAATQLNFTYVLGSKDDYETFAKDVAKAGLDDTYTVQSSDVESYESSLVPLDNLAKFALTLLVIVLAVGAVVLIVINLFNIRERKYEVGVLTAIGVKKAKVAAQFAIELLIVTMIGIALGVAGGAAASVPVSNQLLAQQISSQQSEAQSQQAQFGRNANMGGPAGQTSSNSDADDTESSGSSDSGSSDSTDTGSTEAQPSNSRGPGGMQRAVDYVSTVNATVNFRIVTEMIGIGLLLTLISALAGIISVIRYEPLQILADRS